MDKEVNNMSLEQKREANNSIESEGKVNVDRVKTIDPKLYDTYQVKETRRGKEFYWKDSDKVAFKERGENKLVTESNSRQVAESIVEVADCKGWETIKVSGNEKFRQQVWIEASLKGMDVKGYNPTEQDLHELKQRQQKENTVERDNEKVAENSAERGDPVKKSAAPKVASLVTDKEEMRKPSEQERKNYKLLKEIKEDESTSITKREVEGENAVTVAINNGNKSERVTFKVDEKTQSARPAVLHIAEGDQVDRHVVTNSAVDRDVAKRIESGLEKTHDRQKMRQKDTAIVEEINGDKAPYRDRVDTKAKRDELNSAYSTLPKEEAVKRHPELEELYKIESAANELANRRIGNQQSRDNYVKAIRDRSLNELAKGNDLPKIPQKAPQKKMERVIER
jgi:hypothetical protein